MGSEYVTSLHSLLLQNVHKPQEAKSHEDYLVLSRIEVQLAQE